MKINILITGAGAPGIAGTIYSLRNNSDKKKFTIITSDIENNVAGKFLSDKFYQIPPPEDNNYIECLMSIVKREKVNVLLPQTTREIIILSSFINEFKKLNVGIVVSEFEKLSIANDKYLLLNKAKEINIPYPEYYLANSKNDLIRIAKILGYPKERIVIKPRVSSGMRGLRILNENPWNSRRFLTEKPDGVEITLEQLLHILKNGSWPELLVMEYLPGDEYTVDVFRSENNIISIPRKRERIRSGITFEAKIDLKKNIIDYSYRLAQCLDLDYCFGFQFKLSKEGVPKVIECNPRVQGTMVTSTMAGFNMIYYAVLEALGQLKEIEKINIMNKMRFIRYWGGLGIDDKSSIVGKI